MNTDLIVLAIIVMIVGGIGFFLVLFRSAYHIGYRMGFSKAKNIAINTEAMIKKIESQFDNDDIYVARSEAEMFEHIKRLSTKN